MTDVAAPTSLRERIADLLRGRGRRTYSELASELGESPDTVSKAVRRDPATFAVAEVGKERVVELSERAGQGDALDAGQPDTETPDAQFPEPALRKVVLAWLDADPSWESLSVGSTAENPPSMSSVYPEHPEGWYIVVSDGKRFFELQPLGHMNLSYDPAVLFGDIGWAGETEGRVPYVKPPFRVDTSLIARTTYETFHDTVPPWLPWNRRWLESVFGLDAVNAEKERILAMGLDAYERERLALIRSEHWIEAGRPRWTELRPPTPEPDW